MANSSDAADRELLRADHMSRMEIKAKIEARAKKRLADTNELNKKFIARMQEQEESWVCKAAPKMQKDIALYIKDMKEFLPNDVNADQAEIGAPAN